MMSWTINSEVLTGLSILGVAYLWASRGRHGRAKGELIEPWRIAAFFSGLGLIFLALNGPIHDLAESQLFSVHMVQHLMLIVAPSLLLAGTKGWMFRPLLQIPGVAAIGRRLTRPVVACALFTVVLMAWHLPILYEWALRNHDIHILEHLMFMVAALLLWWPVLSPLPDWPRLAPPTQLLYLFVAGTPMTIVAAFITLSDDVLYRFYGEAPLQWGLSPLADQRLGGVLMWVPGTLIFLVALTIVYFQWAWKTEREDLLQPRGEAHGAI